MSFPLIPKHPGSHSIMILFVVVSLYSESMHFKMFGAKTKKYTVSVHEDGVICNSKVTKDTKESLGGASLSSYTQKTKSAAFHSLVFND